jgi:hypothetical protein
MKLLILLFIICQITSNKFSENSKNFLTGLFKAIRGKDYKLNTQCLDARFDADMDILVKHINDQNFDKALEVGERIIETFKANCPYMGIMAIYNAFHSLMKQGKLFDRTIAHPTDLFKILKSVVNNKTGICASDIGTALGNYYTLVEDADPDAPGRKFLFLEGENNLALFDE